MRIGLVTRTFLGMVMLVGMLGCGGGGDDKLLTVADMAGVYNVTKYTYESGGTSVIVKPPDVSGTLVLSSSGDFTFHASGKGQEDIDASGTFSVVDHTIVIVSGGRERYGEISDDGRRINLPVVMGEASGTWEFTKS